ncbi:MAG: YggS family pyridoxal phosphate-dependent enzyme [Thermodesulfovibrionales bacterium]|nr:YggS family pyridoxal phosphate-dependent enzyme [Thermodesulfovibrionales bacterium]
MITDNLSLIYKRIFRAALRSDRDPKEITLLAVSKTFSLDRIIEAVDAGIRFFGENRVQEAEEKISRFSVIAQEQGYTNVKWHLVGHLQSNKVQKAVRLFDLIHSVDSKEILQRIDKEAAKIGKVQDILIQVKLSEEMTKHGIQQDEVIDVVRYANSLNNVRLQGLMTLPPYFENPEDVRPYFRRLFEIKQRLSQSGFQMQHLSMGMSHDFEVAIEEGATIIRIGTAIFGERIPPR